MSAASAPAPVPPPARAAAQPVGCLPFLVFVLTVAGAAGLLALRCELLPKEDAGQVVMEILEQPSKEEMKAHARRIQSGAVLERVIKNLNAAQSANGREEVRDRLQKNLDVKVSGPFLTITVYEKQQSPAEFASGVAGAFEEDLKAEMETAEKLVIQNIWAQITMNEASTEKARLEWLDIMKKHDLRPDAGSVSYEVISRGIAARLAEATVALVALENEIQQMDAASPPLSDKKSDAARLREEIKSWQKAAKEQDAELLSRIQRRSDMDEAKYRYDSLGLLGRKLREQSMDRSIAASVVKRPVRIVEEARTKQVPDRRSVKFGRLGIAACAVLAAAFLLSALAGRLCRRL